MCGEASCINLVMNQSCLLLGVCAFEVHVCGEASCINLVKELALITGDEVEVRKYKRLTPLKALNEAVGEFMLKKRYR